MTDVEYQCFVAGLCDFLGLSDWRQIVRSGHLEIDGKTVGLVRPLSLGTGLCAAEGGVSVFIDLGPMPELRRAKWQQAMLVANLMAGKCTDGCYGLHPVSGNGVYHLFHPPNEPPQVLADRLDAVFKQVIPQYRDMGH